MGVKKNFKLTQGSSSSLLSNGYSYDGFIIDFYVVYLELAVSFMAKPFFLTIFFKTFYELS